jgi:AraC family transcriptional regulator
LRSSAGLGWSTISAELRSHRVSETPVTVPLHTELIFAVSGNEDGLVRRTGAGQTQKTIPRTGTIWLAPVGEHATITAPLPELMHLYLPTTLFGRLADDFNLPGAPARSIRYVADVQDELIRQLALSILSEMTNESAAGGMFVETASLTLAARLLHSYCDSGSFTPAAPPSHKLDHARLRRVLDYISTHLADEITIAELARVACLSTFHFARMFTLAIGTSPQRYVSRKRLEKAMAEIAAGRLPLANIALNARFSSQASFTRAFRRATGVTPGEYRRHRR